MELPWVNYNFKSIRWCLPGVPHEQAPLDIGTTSRCTRGCGAIPCECEL